MAIFKNISFAEYQAMPGINCSKIKSYLHSAIEGVYNEQNREETAAMKIGSGAHALSLEGRKVYDEQFIVEPKIDRRTKAGKAQAIEFAELAEGKSILTAKDGALVESLADAIANHDEAQALLARCPSREMAITWTDELTGAPMKALIDFAGDTVAGDLKTTADLGDEASVIRTILKYGYDMQFAYYLDGLRANDLPIEEFFAVFAGKAAPCDIAVFKISESILEYGRERYEDALQNYLSAQISLNNGEKLLGRYPDVVELILPKYVK